jgi:hypothetical protein
VTAVRSVVCALIVAIGLPAQAADCEAIIGKYMVGQALLAANYVAAAEKATFDRDPARQPQASAFWPLIAGTATAVVQPAQKVRSTIVFSCRASCRLASALSTSPPANG